MTTWKQWSEQMVKTVAEAVLARRKALGLTAADVSARTASGKPLSRAVISDLETGRKKTLEVTELITLAMALEVSPLTLLVPSALDDVEILPGFSIPGLYVLSWFEGKFFRGEHPGVPNSFFLGDMAMRTALRLMDVESMLRVQRNKLLEMEKVPDVRTMSEHMKAYSQGQADHARRQIELLEAERNDLVDNYRGLIKGEGEGVIEREGESY